MSHDSGRSDERRSRLRRVLGEVSRLEIGALLAGVIAIILFGLLARAVLREELAAFNRDVMLAIHAHATPTLDAVALAVTDLGSFAFVAIAGAFMAWRLWRSGRRIDVWVMVAVLGGGGILSQTLKAVFGQERPTVFEPLYHPMGLSFPSGHSLISYCLAGFVAAWLVTTNPRSAWRWLGALVALLIATLVALTRLYIGVHWPSDVIAGLLIAAFWLAVCFVGRQKIRSRLARREGGASTLA